MPPFGANCGVTNTLKAPTGKDRLRETVRGKASLYSTTSQLALPWLRWSVAGLSTRRAGFDHRPVYVRLAIKQSGTGIGFSPSTPLFPLSV